MLRVKGIAILALLGTLVSVLLVSCGKPQSTPGTGIWLKQKKIASIPVHRGAPTDTLAVYGSRVRTERLELSEQIAQTLYFFKYLLSPGSKAFRRQNVYTFSPNLPGDMYSWNRSRNDYREEQYGFYSRNYRDEQATQDTPKLAEQRAQALQIFGDLQSTTSSSLQSGNDDKPFDFVPYEDSPIPIGRINPVYPEFSRRAGVQGTVMLEIEVYKDGSIGAIKVLRSVQAGPGGLDEAAVNAVRAVRFQPGKSGGVPVDTTVNIPVEFKVN